MGGGSSRASKLWLQVYEFYKKVFKSNFMKLIVAIKRGNIDKVREFHKKGLNFNQYMENGDTPLHVAAANSYFEIVSYICEKVQKVNINDKNFSGDTALLLACINGDKTIVRFLIENGAMVNVKENRGYTPFMAACANGHVEIAKYLVEKTNVKYNSRNLDGQTAMHRAAHYGQLEVLKFLIRSLRMSALTPDKRGNLPIHHACYKLNIVCVRLLARECGRDIVECMNIQNKDRSSSLDILQKMMNRLRDQHEPEYTQDLILLYIRDKNRIPHRKNMQYLASPKESPIHHQPSLRRDFTMDSNSDRQQEQDRLPFKLPLRRRDQLFNFSRWATLKDNATPPQSNYNKISEKSEDNSQRDSGGFSEKVESLSRVAGGTALDKLRLNREMTMANVKKRGVSVGPLRRSSNSNIEEVVATLMQEQSSLKTPLSRQRSMKSTSNMSILKLASDLNTPGSNSYTRKSSLYSAEQRGSLKISNSPTNSPKVFDDSRNGEDSPQSSQGSPPKLSKLEIKSKSRFFNQRTQNSQVPGE